MNLKNKDLYHLAIMKIIDKPHPVSIDKYEYSIKKKVDFKTIEGVKSVYQIGSITTLAFQI